MQPRKYSTNDRCHLYQFRENLILLMWLTHYYPMRMFRK